MTRIQKICKKIALPQRLARKIKTARLLEQDMYISKFQIFDIYYLARVHPS